MNTDKRLESSAHSSYRRNQLGLLLTCSVSFLLFLPVVYGQAIANQHFSSSVAKPASSTAEVSTRVPQEVIVPEDADSHAFSRFGIGIHLSTNGPGIELASNLSRHFNLRVSSDFFKDAMSINEEGVNIAMKLRLQSSRTSLDWFPRGRSLHISPFLALANNTNLGAKASVPQGETMTLDGSNYVSSVTDPLEGSASVSFRHVAPGISLGVGNLVPRISEAHPGRRPAHVSFPVEAGFFYVGQPKLSVNFRGSACDPSEPQTIGCEQVNQDESFQSGLAKFEARNRKNLSYASFYPLFSTGIGFAF